MKNELNYFYFTMIAIGLLGALGSTPNAQAITHVPLYTFNGDTGDDFGASISGSGDVNGGGYDDVIIGAPGDINGTSSGSDTVFSGLDGSELLKKKSNGSKSLKRLLQDA